MLAWAEMSSLGKLIAVLGGAGAAIFYGRFYVQWIVSEIKKRSVVPIAFWYMSGIGSVMLLIYSVYFRQPGAAFGQSFNTVVYSRNLIHVWRERGRLTQALKVTVHTLTGLIVVAGVAFTAVTWVREYHHNAGIPVDQATRNWLWLGVWAVGQALFSARFLIQWLVTEIKRKSVIPPVFWHISIAAAVLQGASYAQRHDWVNMVGTLATVLIYARNSWMIRRADAEDLARNETTVSDGT